MENKTDQLPSDQGEFEERQDSNHNEFENLDHDDQLAHEPLNFEDAEEDDMLAMEEEI